MRRRRPLPHLLIPVLVVPLAALLIHLLALRGRPGAAPPPGPAPGSAAAAAPAPRLVPPPRLPVLLVPPAAPAARASAGPARFEGRVVSAASGAGIPGAELTFARGGAAEVVRAAADGTFRFEPSPGAWLLAAVTAPGHFPFAPEWGHSPVELLAEPGKQVRGIEIHLAPALEIAGRVVLEGGAPAPGAEVRLLGAAGEATLVSIPDRFTADARGEFRAAAPEGSVLEARLPGRYSGRARVDALALVSGRVTIVLGPPRDRPVAPGGEIFGRVVVRGGGPVPGALVLATAARDRWGGGVPVAQASTDGDGRFRLRDLEAGTYRLVARAEEHAPATARAEAGAPDQVVLELPDGGRLRGCVRDASTGQPVAPFTVMVFARHSALWLEPQRSLSVVDPAGCYALADLVPGPAAVVFSAPGRAPSSPLPVDVPAPPAQAELDAALESGGTLSGVVRDLSSGAPLAGAHLAVEGSLEAAASTFPVLSLAVTGDDGLFTLGGLPRRFSVSAAAAGHHARVVGGLETEPGQMTGPIEIRLRPLSEGEDPRTELAGIGVMLSPREDGLVVTQVAPGGGAAEAGMVPGDLLVEVNGQPVTELGFGGAVDLIRGPEGTSVQLTLVRNGATVELSVPRRMVRG